MVECMQDEEEQCYCSECADKTEVEGLTFKLYSSDENEYCSVCGKSLEREK